MKGKELLTHRVHTCITARKYEELSALLGSSQGLKSLSELLRNILDNKKIIVVSRDGTFDQVKAELAAVRKEIQAIGININQVTRRFHREQSAESRLLRAMELTTLFQQADGKITELFTIISRIAERWLQE